MACVSRSARVFPSASNFQVCRSTCALPTTIDLAEPGETADDLVERFTV